MTRLGPTVLCFPYPNNPASFFTPSASPDLMEALGTREKATNVCDRGPEAEAWKMVHVSGDKASELHCDEIYALEVMM